MDEKLKHLEFIQAVINRLASDSFRMKGWSVVVATAFLVFISRVGCDDVIPVGIVPVLVFWGLDGYFLWQERLYRALYDRVRTLNKEDIDFSMNTSEFKDGSLTSWLSAMFSSTLLFFHGVLFLSVGLTILFIVSTGE